MKVWEFMEMIHSRSYTYIIKNIYPDPSEVFDTILDDERIIERAASVTAAYNEFINAAHEYDSVKFMRTWLTKKFLWPKIRAPRTKA